MLEIYFIRPGATPFDEAGRIKGGLDIPLSDKGIEQAEQLSMTFQTIQMDCLYVAPCLSAQASADFIAERNFCKQKTMECLRNLNHGLWQGKLVSEIKRLQPTIYRQFQENPMDICPPAGETVASAALRVQSTLSRLAQKHPHGSIGFLVPEPMASIIQCVFVGGKFSEIWDRQRDSGTYEKIVLRSVPRDGIPDAVVA